MSLPEYYPYRSAECRERCYRYLEEEAANWPVGAEARMVPTRFGATFVRMGGARGAPLIVLLHGAGGTSLMWAPNVEALSRQFRIAAVDQIGEFGRSVCTRLVRTLDDQMAWLDELMAGLADGGRANLVGMSYGGALAAQYALRHPERLEKVVLLAPGATVLRPPVAFWLRLLVLAARRRKGLPAFFRWIFPEMARRDPQWMEATVEMLAMNMRNVVRHSTPMPPVMTDREWGGLRAPTLFLVGEHEVIYSAAKAVRRLRRVAPQVEAEIVPGTGHGLTFAQAAVVNERIVRFLGQGG